MAVQGQRVASGSLLGLIVLAAAAVGLSLGVGHPPSPTVHDSKASRSPRFGVPTTTTSTTAPPHLDLTQCVVPIEPGTNVTVPSALPPVPGRVPALTAGWSVTSASGVPVASGFPLVLDTVEGVAYGLVPTEPLNEAPYELVRFGLGSGPVVVGPALPAFPNLLVAEGYLWASWSTSNANLQPAQVILCQFALGTMSLVRRIALPLQQSGEVGFAMAPGPDRTLLVGYDQSLLTVDPNDGAERNVTSALGGKAAFTTMAPARDVAYVTVWPTTPGVTQEVDEVNLSSGAVLARNASEALGGVGPGSVTAVDTGVWLSWRGGMAGSTVFLRKADLSIAPEPIDPHPVQTTGPGSLFESIMGEGTLYADGVLWIAAGDGQIGCLDPSTGAVRAETTFPMPSVSLMGVGAGGQLYVYYQPLAAGMVLTLDTPPTCFS